MDGPQIDELKELVKVSLQQAGVLGAIKAQLRAEVFKVVNKEQASTGGPAKLATMNTSDGQVATDLVREFLEHFELHSTLAVFLPEASLENGYPGRTQLAQRLGIDDESGVPLLMTMMKNGGVRASTAPSSRAGPSASKSAATSRLGCDNVLYIMLCYITFMFLTAYILAHHRPDHLFLPLGALRAPRAAAPQAVARRRAVVLATPSLRSGEGRREGVRGLDLSRIFRVCNSQAQPCSSICCRHVLGS